MVPSITRFPRPQRLAFAIAAWLAVAALCHAESRVVVGPGDTIGSTPLASIDALRATEDGTAIATATTDAIVLLDGQQSHVLARSGDPSPAGGGERFGALGDVRLNAQGQSAFSALLGTSSRYGIFLVDGAAIRTVATLSVPEPAALFRAIRTWDLGPDGTVWYRDEDSVHRTVGGVDETRSAPTPGGGFFSRSIRAGADGSAVWITSTAPQAVTLWAPPADVQTVFSSDTPLATGGTVGLLIDLAFRDAGAVYALRQDRTAVVRWTSAEGVVRIVSQGDHIDGVEIGQIVELLGVTTDGDLMASVVAGRSQRILRLGNRRARLVRAPYGTGSSIITPSGTVARARFDGSIARGRDIDRVPDGLAPAELEGAIATSFDVNDTMSVLRLSGQVLVEYGETSAPHIVATTGRLPGAGRLQRFFPNVGPSASIAIQGQLLDGRSAIVQRDGDRWRRTLVTGRKRSRSEEFADAIDDATNRTTVRPRAIASYILIGGDASTLILSEQRYRPGKPIEFGLVSLRGRKLTPIEGSAATTPVVGNVDVLDGRTLVARTDGLFELREDALVPVLSPGDPLPDGAVVSQIGAFDAGPGGFVVWVLTHDGRSRLVISADGAITSREIDGRPLQVAFALPDPIVTLTNSSESGLFAATATGTTPLLTTEGFSLFGFQAPVAVGPEVHFVSNGAVRGIPRLAP